MPGGINMGDGPMTARTDPVSAPHSFSELRSHKALVCQKEHRCEQSVRTVWFVLLSDGYLIDCGSYRVSKARADILAAIINESGPEKLSHAALESIAA